VLDDTTAVLVSPEPTALADGLARVLDDRALGDRLAAAAAEFARTRFSREAYLARTAELYAQLWQPAGSPQAVVAASRS
jgi:glycosyltransferase involved in cell wall biosynthesis